MNDYLEAQMENMNLEAVIAAEAQLQTTVNPMDEMADLQLLLVGGGIGDTQL
jgi:hypothetical protein